MALACETNGQKGWFLLGFPYQMIWNSKNGGPQGMRLVEGSIASPKAWMTPDWKEAGFQALCQNASCCKSAFIAPAWS